MSNQRSRIKKAALPILLSGVLLCGGCASGQNQETVDMGGASTAMNDVSSNTPSSSASNTPEQSVTVSPADLPKPDTNYLTDEMIKNGIMAEGSLARLAAVMKKAASGEEITVGVIGGSITQGSLASSPNNSYAYRFYQWWVKAFPNAKVNYVNAGIGATTSYLGVHRVDKDLLSKKPDAVVVEFSVNDRDNPFFKQTYEDLVRKILRADNNPAVILLFMTMEDGTSAQPSHLHVGTWYDLPCISYREMVLKELKKGTFTWQDISPDNIHPNDRGHAMAGELLRGFLNSVYAKLDTITDQVAPLDKDPIFEDAYKDATILDNTGIEPESMGSFARGSTFERYKNGWSATSGNDGIVFETNAANIGIIYYKTTDGKSGQYDVYIDGQFSRTLDADFTGGWGNYAETTEVYHSSTKAQHKIEIRKNPYSKGDAFQVLGLLIS